MNSRVIMEGDSMSVFAPEEIEYLRGQRLGRLATVNAAGEPHVVPVGFRRNAEFDTIDTDAFRPNTRSVGASEGSGAA